MTKLRLKSDGHLIDRVINDVQIQLNIVNRSDVYEAIGVQASTVSRIRSGKEKPSSELILRLYDFLDIPLADLRQMFGHRNFKEIFNATSAANRPTQTKELK